jgi:hypothetical protein
MYAAAEAPAMVSDVVAIPVLFVTLGAVGLYTGWKRRRIHEWMVAAETTTVERASPGVVEFEGAATAGDASFFAPISERDAVVAAWTVEEWDERGDRSRWREVARGIEIAGFELDDGTGTVEVAPVSKRETAGKWTQTTGLSAENGVRIDDTMVEFATFRVEAELAPDADPPVGLRRLHDDHGLYEDTGSITNAVDVGKKHGRRRYTEGVVEPGDSVYVLGRLEGRDGDGDRFRPDEATLTTPADGPFVVSDRDEATLESTFDAAARTRMIAGAISVAAGLGGFAYLFL